VCYFFHSFAEPFDKLELDIGLVQGNVLYDIFQESDGLSVEFTLEESIGINQSDIYFKLIKFQRMDPLKSRFKKVPQAL